MNKEIKRWTTEENGDEKNSIRIDFQTKFRAFNVKAESTSGPYYTLELALNQLALLELEVEVTRNEILALLGRSSEGQTTKPISDEEPCTIHPLSYKGQPLSYKEAKEKGLI